MSEWLIKLFGIPSPGKGTLSGVAFHLLQPWPIVIAVLALLAIPVGVTWMYRRLRRPLPGWMRWMLAGLRISALVLLLLLIFEPVAQVDFEVEKRPRIVVLVDHSQSMELTDKGLGRRMDLVNKFFADKEIKLLSTLQEKYDVDLWNFSSDIKQVELPKGDQPKPPVFTVDKEKGQTTNLGDALEAAFNRLKSEAVSGVVLVSDGGGNAGADPVSMGYVMKNNKMRVFTVGVGDPIPPKDVKLMEPLAPEEVFLGSPVDVEVDVVHVGYKDREVMVKVMQGQTEMGKQLIKLGEDHEKQRVKVRFLANQVGRQEYQLKVSEMPEEISLDNNQRTLRIVVSQEYLKILYVEGKPNRLFRFFKTALYREPTVQFSVLLQSAPPTIEEFRGMRPVKAFPRVKEHLLDYDVLILGDIKRNLLTAAQYELIREFVREGHGFMHVADNVHEGAPASYKGTALEDVLPVSLEGATKEGHTYKKVKGFQMELTPDGKQDPYIMRVKRDQEENLKFWQSFWLTWCAQVGPAKDLTKVLAVNPDKKVGKGESLPLIVQGRYGHGKTLYMGTTELWRTRYGHEDKFFWGEFFRPVLHWLSPSKGAGKIVDLRTDKTKYPGGERVKILAALHGPAMKKLTGLMAKARIAHETGEFTDVELTEETGSEGVFVGAWVPAKAGKYSVSIAEPGPPVLGEPSGKTKAFFMVEVPNLEMEHPEMNEGLLKRISELTEGKYYHIGKAKDLAKDILESRERISLTLEKELHDTPLAAVLLVALFASEWYLRRRRGLA